MLNRLFIAVGLLVIIAISAAFVVPRFIAWGDYRARMEAIATEAFGHPVAIAGDIAFTLLPRPQLQFSQVIVGPPAAPLMEIDHVAAEFSLLDFLRDQYRLTRLELQHPVLDVAIDKAGNLTTGLTLADQTTTSNIAVAAAQIVDGELRLADARSNEIFTARAIDGTIKIEALRGPFSFQGTGTYAGASYGLRVGASALGDDGITQLTLALKPADLGFSVETTGTLSTAGVPHFSGELTYRKPPPPKKPGEPFDAGRGDLVVTGTLEAGPDRLLLPAYTVSPDENRAGTRLTGAAELKLGAGRAFNAVISGGVIALPPRDATAELTDPPYELVRLLGEMPLPVIPGVPGTIGVDIAEFNLRAVSLRDIRLDAATDAKSWTIKTLSATLPGGTSMTLAGNFSAVDGHSIFAGGITLDSPRLDLLAGLWRKPAAGNPLFNRRGTLTADVALSSDTLTLSSGTLVVGGINQAFDAAIGFGPTRRLKLSAHITSLGPEESATLAALLPDITADTGFGATFPRGEIDLTASRAMLFGLDGTELVAKGSWEGGVFEINRLAAADLGGAKFDVNLTAFGTLAMPEISGSGTLAITDPDAPALTAILAQLNAPPALAAYLKRSLPADIAFRLDAPRGGGGQGLAVSGQLASSTLSLDARLGAGIVRALSAPLSVALDLKSGSASRMISQLGLDGGGLFPGNAPIHLVASLDGTPADGLKTSITLDGGGDSLAYEGSVTMAADATLGGEGTVEAALSDPSAAMAALGSDGIYIPPFKGHAKLAFTGLDAIKASGLEGSAGGVPFSGDIALAQRGDVSHIDGTLAIAALDAGALLPVLAGPAATINSASGFWPDGPLDLGRVARTIAGRVTITTSALTLAGAPFLSDARFDLDWDVNGTKLRGFEASLGGGRMTLDLSLCCSGGLTSKRLSGRLSLNNVAIDALLPAALAAGLDGVVGGVAQFDGSGDSLNSAMAAMTGSGSYTIAGLSIQHFSPEAFAALGATQNVVDTPTDALAITVLAALDDAPLRAPNVSGSFTLAGGTLRSPNLAIEADGARVFGGLSLKLTDLGLAGSYAMSPTTPADADALVDANAQIVAELGGTLLAPTASYDVAALVDAIKIKASEIELARLEKLRAEDEARRQQAAIEKARIAEEAAAAAARKAEAQAAADAAARKAAEQSSQPPPIDFNL